MAVQEVSGSLDYSVHGLHIIVPESGFEDGWTAVPEGSRSSNAVCGRSLVNPHTGRFGCRSGDSIERQPRMCVNGAGSKSSMRDPRFLRACVLLLFGACGLRNPDLAPQFRPARYSQLPNIDA